MWGTNAISFLNITFFFFRLEPQHRPWKDHDIEPFRFVSVCASSGTCVVIHTPNYCSFLVFIKAESFTQNTNYPKIFFSMRIH